MLKKIFLTLAFVASVALMAKAQQITGQWTIYPQIGFTIDRLVDTPEHAYYLTAGSLYSYDSADNENFVYTTSNRLTDTGISDIYYNYDGRYLLVAYSNGNIDLLYDDGRTVNMPDIKDALLTVGRGINSVAFGSDRIYVATQFGLVIFDDTRHEVVESGIWNRNIDEVFLLGDTLMLIEGFTLYGAPCDGRHNSIDKFDVYGGCSGREVTAISDDTYFFKLSTNLTDLYYGKIDREAKTVRLYNLNTRLSGDIQNTPAGIYAAAGDKINIYNPDATLKSTVAIPEAVPRNDGTNFGDYLLETETIYDIASDPTDRKWIATGSSGVYLVSERGDRIIENFTTANSPLPSNTVYSVACDPHSNRVFFGTSKGVVSYSSDSAPAADDYSEVYAFPNPVRPDYTGWITVTGLMDNSLVKIADISGNVLHQGRSEGGIFTWDGCNAAGERVRSGVYLVLASQNASGNSSGVVTKIMVIN